jgi:hypothetical protein
MPGTQVFTYFNVGKETAHGTPVAPTRQLYGTGTGMFDVNAGLNFHENENTGRRYRTRRVTQTLLDVGFKFASDSGTSYDDLVIPFSQIRGGQTGAGAGADKTWTMTPAPTALNNPESYSIDAGDDIQNWRLQYAQLLSFKIAAALGDVTSLEMEGFAQNAVKGAKATPAINASLKIPGELWTIKFATTIAGLTGATVVPNFLVAWELEVMTGLQWRHYMDGGLFGAQSVETDIAWKLTLTAESQALTVSEFYDKALSQAMDFIRLRAQGPVLGGSFYSAQIDMPVLYEEPEIISAEDNGINLWKVVAHGSDDGTNGLIPVIVNSLAALP